MIGYTLRNNDLWIFFKNKDIERLGKSKIEEQYVNLAHSTREGIVNTCTLEAEVIRGLNDMTMTTGEKGEDGLFTKYEIKIRGNVYDEVISEGWSGIHEGFRHVTLVDITKFNDSIESNMMLHQAILDYQQLRERL